MSRSHRLALGFLLPTFLVVFAIVRAVWLGYVATLSESELHERVFEHSTAVALTLWIGCVLLALAISLALGRLFARRRGDGHDAPGPTALAQVYERAGRYFIEPSDRTRWSEAGYWIATGRVTVLDSTTSDDELGAAILDALATCRVEVPVPPRGTKLEAGLFGAMGVRSRRAAMSGTRGCLVTREPPGEVLRIEPHEAADSAPDDRGHGGVPEWIAELPAASLAPDVGRAVRAALARAPVGA